MEEKSMRRIPIVAIRDSVVFPHTDSVLTFGRKRSVAAVNTSFQEDRVIAIFTQKDPRTNEPGEDDLYKVGTIAIITQMMSTEGEVHAVVRGQARIKLTEVIAHEPYLVGKVIEIAEDESDRGQIEALSKRLSKLFKKSINLGKQAEITTVIKLVSGQAEPKK